VLWAIVAPIAHAFPHLRTNSLRVSPYTQVREVSRAQRVNPERHAETRCVATDSRCRGACNIVVCNCCACGSTPQRNICDASATDAIRTLQTVSFVCLSDIIVVDNMLFTTSMS
jgi:hypothetical protein